MTRIRALAAKVRLREQMADMRRGAEQNVVRFPVELCRVIIDAPFVTDPLPSPTFDCEYVPLVFDVAPVDVE